MDKTEAATTNKSNSKNNDGKPTQNKNVLTFNEINKPIEDNSTLPVNSSEQHSLSGEKWCDTGVKQKSDVPTKNSDET